ncbi:hypothetical protein M8J77_003893 [Diaphorina citri]|nr:hypothetical protein M8J77_003893 [Diaphorina citri]
MSHISKKFKITEASDMVLQPAECFKQGAEGRIFKTEYLGRSVLVKERFSKKYRHPKLDEALTKERITSEIRGLMKCRMAGIRTPTVYAVNSLKNQIIMELIDGRTVKDILLLLEQNLKDENIGDENEMSVDEDDSDEEEMGDEKTSNLNGKSKSKNSNKSNSTPVPPTNIPEDICLDDVQKSAIQTLISKLDSQNITRENISDIVKLLSIEIGTTLSVMHSNNIIHGDLTTSNMILSSDHHLVMIDFGLSQIKVSTEDKAVDLYVLKRAILSLHSIFSRDMFNWILSSYRRQNRKQFETVMKTFAEVELRGRKRCMVG